MFGLLHSSIAAPGRLESATVFDDRHGARLRVPDRPLAGWQASGRHVTGASQRGMDRGAIERERGPGDRDSLVVGCEPLVAFRTIQQTFT